MLVGSNTNSQYLCNCEPQLPPKGKESEKMLMIQRWINNLPMPYILEYINKKYDQTQSKDYEVRNKNICQCGSLHPKSPPRDDEPENVPPPGKIFSARAPFTTEDHINFSSSGSTQQVQQKILANHNIMKQYYCNHKKDSNSNSSSIPNPNNKAYNKNSSTTNGRHHQQQSEHEAKYNSAIMLQKRLSCSSPSPPSRKYQKVNSSRRLQKDGSFDQGNQLHQNSQLLAQLSDSQQTSKDSRHFTPVETKLVVELFEDYFNYSGELPSLAEVRNRIGSTFLIQTRSAVSVRAKIKRLSTSGTWTQFKS